MSKAPKRWLCMCLCICFLSVIVCLTLSACNLLSNVWNDLWDDDDILSVRERVETLRYEMSETIILGFKNSDTLAIKELFCPKSRELPDIDTQIENTFSFMEGQIQTYTISRDTVYEGYSNDYGTVTDYEFSSNIRITTDAGRIYDLSFRVKYITQDEIKGMTEYRLIESDKDFETYQICCAGYMWVSPYDAEIGILGANIVKALGNGDETALRSVFCAKSLESPAIDQQIHAAIALFDGKPVFAERADGLYGYSADEKDLGIANDYNYHVYKNDNGDITDVWVGYVHIAPIYTDTNKKYKIVLTAYLSNELEPELVGVSVLELIDYDNEDNAVTIGEWIHEDR